MRQGRRDQLRAFNQLTNSIGTPNILWSKSLWFWSSCRALTSAIVFFGCSLAGAACMFLLPESKMHDAGVVYAQELEEGRIRRAHAAQQ